MGITNPKVNPCARKQIFPNLKVNNCATCILAKAKYIATFASRDYAMGEKVLAYLESFKIEPFQAYPVPLIDAH